MCHGCGAKPVQLKTCMAEEPLNSPGFLSAQHVLLPKSAERPEKIKDPTPKKNRSQRHRGVRNKQWQWFTQQLHLSCSNCLSFSHQCASVINTRPSFTWNAKFSSGWSWKLMAQVCHQNGIAIGIREWIRPRSTLVTLLLLKGGVGDTPKRTAQPIRIQLLTKYYYR